MKSILDVAAHLTLEDLVEAPFGPRYNVEDPDPEEVAHHIRSLVPLIGQDLSDITAALGDVAETGVARTGPDDLAGRVAWMYGSAMASATAVGSVVEAWLSDLDATFGLLEGPGDEGPEPRGADPVAMFRLAGPGFILGKFEDILVKLVMIRLGGELLVKASEAGALDRAGGFSDAAANIVLQGRMAAEFLVARAEREG